MWEFFEKLTLSKSTNIILIILGCVAAPYWFLFQFYPSLFKNNDILKILLLAISIGFPACLAWTFIFSLFFKMKDPKDDNVRAEYILFLMGVSSLYCGFSFYISCSAKYNNPKMQPSDALVLVLFLQLGAISYFVIKLLRKLIRWIINKRKSSSQ